MLSTTLITLTIAGSTLSSYAPSFVACPGNTTLLRLTGTPAQGNQTLNPDEVSYIAGKKALVPAALATYLGNLSSTVYGGALDATVVPTISLAISGGGDRAGLFGAGVLSAMDGRNSSSSSIGGLLQTASYISALSGGSWMLTSILFNDFPMMYPMILGDGTNNGWSLQNDLFTPVNASFSPVYVAGIMADLTLKRNAGFPVSFGDYWTRTLSRHYLPGTTYANFFDNTTSDHGASITFSSATQLSSYKSHALPFPIIVGAVLSPTETDAPLKGEAIPLSNVVYEMTPVEFGSYDPVLAAFIPMSYLGTAMKSGTPYGGNSAGNCVNNFDNAGFITGISSNLFNLYNATFAAPAWTSNQSAINIAWNLVNTTFFSVQPTQQMDISAVPNPFQGLQPGVFKDTNQTQLTLVDGGIDGQVDPIAPLEVPARKIDLMIVVDGSADTKTNYPIGNSMVATALRSQILSQQTFAMPPIPLTTDTYVTQGLAIRPSFFGCAGTPAKLNGTKVSSPYPIVVYLPNYDPTGVTNTSTSQLVYSNAQASRFLDVASSIATRGIPTASGGADPLWPTCLACTTVERVRGRNGIDMTAACSACFTRYCWNGVESAAIVPAGGNSTTPTAAGGNSTSTAVKPTGTASGVVAPSATATSGASQLLTSASAAFAAVAAFYLF